jgi:hypothetical protein
MRMKKQNQASGFITDPCGYLEHMDMGVPRKIIKNMLEHNGTMPELIEDGERFIVRLLAVTNAKTSEMG